jgi:hypothetical protein
MNEQHLDAMTTDFRALCAELLADYEQNRFRVELAAEARTALAQREPEGPTEEELELERVARDLQWCARGWEPRAMLVGNVRASEIDTLCAAFLARWGRPTPPVVMPVFSNDAQVIEPPEATLLVPYFSQPVPVSERLPGPGDCDAEGRCWLGGEMFAPGDPTWVFGFPAWAERFPEVHRFWLPAHALPVPAND